MARSRLRLLWIAAAGATLVISGLAIGAERQVAVVIAARDGDRAARDAVLAEAKAWPADRIPSRAAIGLAALWLRRASETTPARPDPLALSQAQAMLAQADADRSNAASTLLLHSQLSLLTTGRLTPGGRQAFIASYAAAPFLTGEGPWRTAYAANFWRDLPAATQDAALEEAVWLAGLDGRLRDRLAAIMGGSPMGMRFALRAQPERP